jgi:GntP family gluconate:H+ symporter
VFYILAIMAGGSIAHSLIPPTPGPLQVADILKVDLLTLIVAGLSVGALSSVFSLATAWWLNSRIEVPLRPLAGELGAEESIEIGQIGGPPFFLSLMPILVPIGLIAVQTITSLYFKQMGDGSGLWLLNLLSFLGDRNVALGIGAAIAIGLLRSAPETTDRRAVIAESVTSAGVVILITSAGGAFGAMLGQSGIAERLATLGELVPGLMLLPVAFGLTAAIRTVQGSATVAMITSAGILQGLANDQLPFHPVYLVLAIGGGSKPIAWMNDSGFWVMCKMSGMTESEGLRTVSPLTIAMGLSTLFWTVLAAHLVPLR